MAPTEDAGVTALVGATGGAGTTETTLALAAVLAAGDRSVTVLDAAYATQGLADRVPGRLDPDLTALVTDASDTPLEAGLVDLQLETPGRVACCPARAPFERLARAKSPAAAQRLAERLREATTTADHVLVDVPPVAANQAVAAVDAADRVGVVAPTGDRGADALERTRTRLADLGVSVDYVVATGGETPGSDVTVPRFEDDDLERVVGDEAVRAALVTLAADLVGVDASTWERAGGLFDRVSDVVRSD